MATKKINVRSPFYVEINAQSPPSPTPPTPTATLYQWGGLINYSDNLGSSVINVSSYNKQQLEDEFICKQCNGPSETSNKRSQYAYSQYKSNRLPMQVGDQVYDENGAALTVAATRGTIAYGIENGAILETGINPCQKSTAFFGGETTYKQYLSHIYTWDSSGIITAVDIPVTNCEDKPINSLKTQIIDQDLLCGQTFSIGEDIGSRRFLVDGTNKLGNFTFTVTSEIPVQILTTVNGVQTDQKYVGGDNWEPLMLDSGVQASELVNLTSGNVGTSVFTLNKTSTDLNQVILEVRAPVTTSEVTIQSSLCPADISRDAAPAITGTTGSIIPGSTAMIFEFDTNMISSSQVDAYAANASVGLEISINSSVVKTLSPAQLNWNENASASSNIKSFILTNIISSEYEVASATAVTPNPVTGNKGFIKDKTPILVNCSTLAKAENRISFKWTSSNNDVFVRSNNLKMMRTGLFYDSISSSYKWADAYLHSAYNNYGFSSIRDSDIGELNGNHPVMSNAVNKSYEIQYEITRTTPEQHGLSKYRYPRPNNLNINNSEIRTYTSEGAYNLHTGGLYGGVSKGIRF